MTKKPSPLSPDEERFVSDSKAALLNKTTSLANGILYTLALLLVIGLIWAYFSNIDQRTTGLGKVIPSSEDKIVQSLDGGIVDAILVHEGDKVKQNQILVKLDDTRYAADFRNGFAKYLTLSALVARLTAETQGSTHITFPPDVQRYPQLEQLETNLFEERRQSLDKEITVLKDNLNLATKEFGMYDKLVAKGVVTRLNWYDAKGKIDEIQSKILEKQDQFRETALTELNQRRGELDSITAELVALRDKMVRATLRAPVNGIIKKIYIKTVGGVVNPGMDIMEIVPLSDSLLIEAHVQPSDIAFIHVGQAATVKITAYDYSIYGSLDGKVEYISADAIEEAKPSATEKSLPSYYLVRVKTDRSYLGNKKNPLPIMPGMTTVVQIVTGKKTVLDYLLKPLLKAKEEALRER